jgi:ankyrin repeat protein
VGNKEIAEYLLEKGAPLEICTAAMLGRAADVTRLLDEQPERIHARGAHGITLLAHAALSGDASLLQMLFERGAHEGASLALGNAVMKGRITVARWLIENASPDLAWKNHEDKSLLTIAGENGDNQMTALLREHGAA